MRISRWMKRLVILDLFLLCLLFFLRAGKAQVLSAQSCWVGKMTQENGVMSTDGQYLNGENKNGGYKQDAQEEEKKIALTFDDGPHPVYTERLLEGLKKRGVTATFFVTGEHAKLHPELIARMAEEGHVIGNHTYSHMQLKQDNREKFKQELVATNEIIRRITGESVCFVRPPYGIWDKKLESELSMLPVLWTIDPLDWCSDNAECIAEQIIQKAKENDIILLHDYYSSSVEAALKVVDALQQQGFVFVGVEEILFD